MHVNGEVDVVWRVLRAHITLINFFLIVFHLDTSKAGNDELALTDDKDLLLCIQHTCTESQV